MDSLRPYERFEVIQDLIKRIESLPIIEVSEDCISREYLRSKVYDADDDDLVVDWDDIANAPSVIPSRPHDTERTDENGIQIFELDGEELVPRTEYELTKQALRYTQAELRASRPRGEWIRDPKNQGGFTPGGNAVMSCSCCGWIYGAHRIIPDYNYCPNCGADMREEEK